MTRTRHQALKDALPAIEAWVNGKRVRAIAADGVIGPWLVDKNCPDFSACRFRWEIEPEPQYKPFSPEKLWEMAQRREILVRKSDNARCYVETYNDDFTLRLRFVDGSFLYKNKANLLLASSPSRTAPPAANS